MILSRSTNRARHIKSTRSLTAAVVNRDRRDASASYFLRPIPRQRVYEVANALGVEIDALPLMPEFVADLPHLGDLVEFVV